VEPVSNCALDKYCTAGLCIQLHDGVDQLLTHVVFVHSGPQCVMPHPVKRLFEVDKDVVDVLLQYYVMEKQLFYEYVNSQCNWSNGSSVNQS
jgi:hypothetical protein